MTWLRRKFKNWRDRRDNMKQKIGEGYKKFTDEELIAYQKIFDGKGQRKIKLPDNCVVNSLEDVFKHLYDNIPERRVGSVYIKGKEHCEKGRYRSVEDVYKIAKNYLPRITVKDVYLAFEHLNTNKIVTKRYCYTVHKVVYSSMNYGLDNRVILPKELNIVKNEEIPCKSKK